MVQRWRRQLREESLSSSKKSNNAPSPARPSGAKEIASLKRENERLKERLRQAELIIDVQKKSLGDDADTITREDRLKAAEGLAKRVGVSAACRGLNVSRATFYRRREPNRQTQAKAELQLGRFRSKNETWCLISLTANVSLISHRGRSTRSCLMKVITCAACGRCIAFSPITKGLANGVTTETSQLPKA